jgi:tetratricopeptide (TPR) repeat protein
MVVRHDSTAQALFYDDLIDSYLDDRFVDRPWLTERLERAVADPECRFVLLTAAPGAGKTAFLAWLARTRPDWPRYFIRRDSQAPLSSGDARSLLFAIGHQLASLRPLLFRPEKLEVVVSQRAQEIQSGGKVVGISVEDLRVSPFYQTSVRVEQDVALVSGELEGLSVARMVVEERFLELSNLQHLALLDPARVLGRDDPAARIIILVDALDELRYTSGRHTILDWLVSCPELPQNVCFILSTRPDKALLDAFRKRQGRWLREEAIDPREEAVRSDLHRYAMAVASRPPLGRILTMRPIDAEAVVAQLVEKAEGNFLYLAALFRGIEQELVFGHEQYLDSLVQLRDLPNGLEGLYAFFLSLIRDQVVGQRVELATPEDSLSTHAGYLPAWEGLYLPILGILAVARDSLTLPQIRNLGGIRADDDYVRGALERLGQFLGEKSGRYRLYHGTFPEFLTSSRTRERHPDFYRDPLTWHRRIASHYRSGAIDWIDVDWPRADDYGLTHLAAHVYALRDSQSWRQELYRLPCAKLMWAKLDRFGTYQPFAQDLLLALAAAESEQPPNLVEEVRASWACSTLKELSGDVPPEALGVLTRMGKAVRARGFASLIRDGAQRSRAFRFIGMALIDQGDVGPATEMFQLALEAAREYQDGIVVGVKDEVLREASAALRQVGCSGGSVFAPEAEGLIVDEELSREGAATRRPTTQSGGAWDSLGVEEHTKAAQAAAAALRVSDPNERAEALARAAQRLAQAGDCRSAKVLAQQALSDPWAICDPTYGPRALVTAVAVAARCDDRENVRHARNLAMSLQDRTFRTEALQAVAIALAEVGDTDLALQAIESIPYDYGRNPALAGIARARLVAGDRATAESVLDGLLLNVHALKDPEPQARTYRKLGLALAEVGETAQAIIRLQRAVEAAELISVANHGPTGAAHRETLRANLAHDLSILGQMEEAIRLIDSVIEGVNRFSEYDQIYLRNVVSYIPPTLARAGSGDRARLIADNLPYAWMRIRSLLDIAPILRDLGSSDDAFGAVESAIANVSELLDKDQSDLIAEIAECLCELGRSDLALEVLKDVSDQHRWLLARAKMAHIHVRAGRLSTAAETLRDAMIVVDPLIYASDSSDAAQIRDAQALAELASALAAAGDKAEAERLSGRALSYVPLVGDEYGRADCLRLLAIALVRATDPPGIGGLLDAFGSFRDELPLSNAIRVVAEAFAKERVSTGLLGMAQRANSLADQKAKTNALSGLAQAMSRAEYHDEAIIAWRSAFASVRLSGRPEIYGAISVGAPIIAALDRGRTLLALEAAMQQVDHWWTAEITATRR